MRSKEEHDERKCTIASVSYRLSASVALNNQNKKNREKKSVEADTKLLDVPLNDEDFELLYAVNENNLLGLLEYLQLNCSFNGSFNEFNNNLSTYIISTIPHGKCFVLYLRTSWLVLEISTRSLRSLVRFLILHQLVRKYRTRALSVKYSINTEVTSAVLPIL